MAGQHRLELPPEEEVDPCEQDRRHARSVERSRLVSSRDVGRGSALRARARADPGARASSRRTRSSSSRGAQRRAEERDFFQGLVHVAVGWYQAGRGNRSAASASSRRRARRLAPYAPAHRGVDVADVLAQVGDAQATVAAGSLAARAAADPSRTACVEARRAATTAGPKKSSRPRTTRIEPADDLDVVVVVAEPAERSHRGREHDARHDERDGEPERVREQQQRSLRDRARVAGEHERRREDRADARRRAGRRRPRRAARASRGRAPRRAGPARRTLGQRQEVREREPEDDEHEAGDLLERALADRARERRDGARRARRRRP